MKHLSLPALAYAMEIGLLPLLLLMFVFGGPVSQLIHALGFDGNRFTNIWFIQEQVKLFATHGIKLASVEADLQAFGLIVWISLPIVLLRLVTAPCMLGYLYASATAGGRSFLPASPGKALAGFVLAGPGALWASTHFSHSSVLLLVHLLNHAPRAYVWVQALVFIGGLILSAEAIVWLMVLVWSRRLNGSEKSREWDGSGQR